MNTINRKQLFLASRMEHSIRFIQRTAWLDL
jgi:hypothetical protein